MFCSYHKKKKGNKKDCNIEFLPEFPVCWPVLWIWDSRLQHQLLTEFLACLPAPWVLDSPAPMTGWTNSLKQIFLCLSFTPPPLPHPPTPTMENPTWYKASMEESRIYRRKLQESQRVGVSCPATCQQNPGPPGSCNRDWDFKSGWRREKWTEVCLRDTVGTPHSPPLLPALGPCTALETHDFTWGPNIRGLLIYKEIEKLPGTYIVDNINITGSHMRDIQKLCIILVTCL